jgi:hypothetical protein
MTTSTKVMSVLGVLLIAAVVVSGAILVAVPPASETQAPAGGGTGAGFNIQLLQRQVFQLLNRQPIQDKSLPVAPPAVVGKANPFL